MSSAKHDKLTPIPVVRDADQGSGDHAAAPPPHRESDRDLELAALEAALEAPATDRAPGPAQPDARP